MKPAEVHINKELDKDGQITYTAGFSCLTMWTASPAEASDKAKELELAKKSLSVFYDRIEDTGSASFDPAKINFTQLHPDNDAMFAAFQAGRRDVLGGTTETEEEAYKKWKRKAYDLV